VSSLPPSEYERETLRALHAAESNLIAQLAALVPELERVAQRQRLLRQALKWVRREIRAREHA